MKVPIFYFRLNLRLSLRDIQCLKGYQTDVVNKQWSNVWLYNQHLSFFTAKTDRACLYPKRFNIKKILNTFLMLKPKLHFHQGIFQFPSDFSVSHISFMRLAIPAFRSSHVEILNKLLIFCLKHAIHSFHSQQLCMSWRNSWRPRCYWVSAVFRPAKGCL